MLDGDILRNLFGAFQRFTVRSRTIHFLYNFILSIGMQSRREIILTKITAVMVIFENDLFLHRYTIILGFNQNHVQ